MINANGSNPFQCRGAASGVYGRHLQGERRIRSLGQDDKGGCDSLGRNVGNLEVEYYIYAANGDPCCGGRSNRDSHMGHSQRDNRIYAFHQYARVLIWRRRRRRRRGRGRGYAGARDPSHLQFRVVSAVFCDDDVHVALVREGLLAVVVRERACWGVRRLGHRVEVHRAEVVDTAEPLLAQNPGPDVPEHPVHEESR